VYLRVLCGQFLHENFTAEDTEVHRGDSFGGDSFGGDSFGGDSFGGDSFGRPQ
jgi:hypothetical protein